MGLTMTRGRHFNSGALMALATDLNEFTHFVANQQEGIGMLLVQTMLFLGKLVIHLALILVEAIQI